MTEVRILVAGIGNTFLGDDAFGCEVARLLAARPQPDGVRVVDFGIRGFDLAHALLEGDDAAILVDATPRGEAPGTLYLIEPDPDALSPEEGSETALETHGMDPVRVLRLAHAMGGRPKKVLVVGCEPAEFDLDDEGRMGLSTPVQEAVDEAVGMVESVIEMLRGEDSRQALQVDA